MKNKLTDTLTTIQGEGIEFNIIKILFCYVILAIGLKHFILDSRKSIIESFYLGVFVYSVFNSTNYIFFKHWPFSIVLIDSLWGGVLFALTTNILFNHC